MPDDRSTIWLAETLAEALDARDSYTAGHGIRVGDYAHAIALDLGFGPPELEQLRVAAQLHDIGKIGIPDGILLKPGPLKAEEYGLVKLHPQIGRRILEKAQTFEELLPIVELHHENFDGTGYPYGLAGDKIPLGARIVRVADSFDAMTTDRAYRPAYRPEAAMREIQNCSSTHFDPQVVMAFVRVFKRSGTMGFMAGGSGRFLWAGIDTAQTQDDRSNQESYEPALVRIPQPSRRP